MKKLGWFNTTLRRRIAAGLVALLTVTTVVPSFSAGDEIHLINDLGGYGGGLSAEEEAERDWNEDLVSVAKSAWLDAHSGEDRERNEASPSVLAYTEEIPATGSELNRGETAPAYSNAYDVFADFDESAAAGAVSSYLKKARKEEKAKSGDFLRSMLKEAVIPEAGVPRDNDLKKEILALQKMNDDDYEVFHMGGTYRPVSGDILFVAGHISTGEESPASASNISKGSSEGIVHMAVPQVQDAVLAMEEAASVQIPVYGASISEATPSEMEQTIVSDTNPAESDEALLVIADVPQEPEMPAVAETDVVLAEDMNQAEEANSNHIENDSENHSQEVSEEQIQEIIAEEEAKALKRNAKNAVLAGIVIAGPEENGSDKITFLYSTAKGNVEIGVISANEPRIIGCADMEELHDKYCGILEELEEEAEEAEISEEETLEAPLEETEKTPNEKTEYVWKKGNLTVTATLTDPDAVPDDAELVVTPVTKSTKGYNYQAYMDALSGEIASSNENNTVLYDVAFLADEKDEHGEKTGRTIELQPEDDKVKVNFRFSSAELTDEIGAEYAEKVRVIHLPLVPEVKESADTTKDAVNIAAADISTETMDARVAVGTKSSKIEFTAEDFSVFAIVYTVDFEYEGYLFSIPGGATTKLTDILKQLGINVTDKQIIDASFTNEDLARVYKLSENITRKMIVPGSDSTSTPMVAVRGRVSIAQTIEDKYTYEEYVSGTWVFDSKAAFKSREQLTVTFEDGNEIAINVTDDQNADGTWNLANSTSSFTVSTNSETNDIDRSASLSLDFTYTIKQDDFTQMKAAAEAGEDVVLVYDFNSALKDGDNNIIAYADEVKNGMIMVGSRQIGNYTIKDGKLTLTVTSHSWLAGRTNLSGTFGLSVAIDEDAVENHDGDTFEFPGAGDIEVTYKKKVEEAEKTVWAEKKDDGSYILHYSANIKANQRLNTLTFSDTYSGLQTLNEDSVKINGRTVSITENGKSFSISNENLRSALNISSDEKIPAGTYRVDYTTTVTAEDLKNAGESGTDEKNKAKWTADGTDKEKGTETHLKYEEPPAPPIPFEKTSEPASGTQLSTDGQEITYVIKVGDANTSLEGLHVTDSMTDLQTLNNGKVYIAYGSPDSARMEMPANSVKWTNDNNYSSNYAQVFDYTFTSGNGPAYIIYTTTSINQATATAAGIYGTVNANNSANLVNDNQWKSTQHPVPFKEQERVVVSKTAAADNANSAGSWVPGSTVSYTLTIGTVVSGSAEGSTNLNNMHVWDDMTDIQKLDTSSVVLTVTHPDGTTSTVTNVVVNGQTVPVSQAIKSAATDDIYSKNTVNAFDFNLPSNIGSGQLVITYKTKLPDVETAKAQGIRDIVDINNTGHGGNGSDGTHGTGEYEPSPKMEVEKLVDGEEITRKEPEGIVTYTVNYGYDKEKKMDGVIIKDEMTDIQKLVLDENGNASIKITVNYRPEADIKDSQGNILLSQTAWDAGTHYFYMPKASGQWHQDGYSWPYFDDDSYSANNNVRVFWYTLPTGLGVNSVTVEFKAQVISQADADNNSIIGTQHAKNKALADNTSDETDVTVPFNEVPKHYPRITKKFDHWDNANSGETAQPFRMNGAPISVLTA